MLELAIARAVFDRFEDASEGRLAKIRAHVVSRQSCAAVAKELDLGERLASTRATSPGRAPAHLPKPERARGRAGGGDRGALPRARLRDRSSPRSSRRSRRRSSTRARATSTTRRSCKRRWRARGRRCTTRCSRSRGRRTTAASSALRTSPACSSAWDGARRRRLPSRRPRARRWTRSASLRTDLVERADSLAQRSGSVGVGRECGSGAPAHAPHPRLQVVPGTARDHARAGRSRHRRPERLGQVEHRRRGRLGGRLADAVGAARREAGRRPLRGRRRPQGRRSLRGRARLRQRGRQRGRISTSARSRSRAGSSAAPRVSTS